MQHFVVVGAGQAGSSLVAKLRDLGFAGQITLIGEENVLPYQRPPLSKKYLQGDMDRDRLFLRSQKFYDDNNIEVRTGVTVSGVNPAGKTLEIDGVTVPYDQLALATGSHLRKLPARMGGDLAGVYGVRGLRDADVLGEQCQPGRHLVIIGGGYIGLEVAATAIARGLKVTLVEMADRILQRVAAKQTSDFFRELHSTKGVDIREGVGVNKLIGEGHVSAVELSDGTVLESDLVLVAVGIDPTDALAREAGLELDNGIKTDAHGRTSDPNIWSAGDCASFPHNGERIRLESVPNAIEQAECVAANMLAKDTQDDDKVYIAKPWFWSDQYDIKLQIAGLNTGYTSVVEHFGKRPGSRSFWYYKGRELVAVDAINDPKAFMTGRRIIEAK
ncbi:MAG: pyridine nucleotide-disulfide oxidoreductase [Hyphomicrobiales bacterium]|nr:MAG: pyridine nucleotide-disulfide oxidoreductase [Hyphomicrobiales bacterium]